MQEINITAHRYFCLCLVSW